VDIHTWFTAAAPQHGWPDEMAAIFMPAEAPVDASCTTATLILDLVQPVHGDGQQPPRAAGVQRAQAFPLRLPDLLPPTVTSLIFSASPGRTHHPPN